MSGASYTPVAREEGGVELVETTSTKSGPPTPSSSSLAAALKWIKDQMLPIGLLIAISVGMKFPSVGASIGALPIPATKIAAGGIFFIGGLQLETEDAMTAIKTPMAIAYGVTAILFLTGVVGTTLNALVPLPVPDLSLGISIFMCMPCTIISSTALAQQAGGSFALGVMFSLICTITSVFTVPWMLVLFSGLSGAGRVALPVAALTKSLVIAVLLPLALGKGLATSHASARPWIRQHKPQLAVMNVLLIVLTPWIQISNSSSKGTFSVVSPLRLFEAVGLVALIHLLLLLFNYLCARVIRLELAMVKTVVFVASSKTLPLSLTILAMLPAPVGDKGLMAIPCILGHFSQIVLDAIVVSFWKKYT